MRKKAETPSLILVYCFMGGLNTSVKAGMFVLNVLEQQFHSDGRNNWERLLLTSTPREIVA